MAIGTYNPIRSADIAPENLDVFYTFSPSREENSNTVFRLTATDVLTPLLLPNDEQEVNEENLLGGIYNLSLPSTIFNQLGIYTIFIRPRVITLNLEDCGVLSSLPTVKGILLNKNDLDANLTTNNALQGYRVEYINSDGTKLRNVVRYITTSNKVIPVTENIGSTSQQSVRYRFDDTGDLIFCQLTPSSASSVKPNATPFIGNAGQKILLNSGNINPIAIEIEFVENDIDSVINFVGGETVRDVDNGIVTYYDADRNIVKQFDLFEVKDQFTNESLFEVKRQRTDIDDTQDINNIIDSVE